MELVWCGDDPEKYSGELISNKAKGLMQLYNGQKSGFFSVPDFFVIPADFMKNYVEKKGLHDVMQIYDVKQVNEIYYRTRGSYIASGAPQAISNKFIDFFDEYSEKILPAMNKLTNADAYNAALKRNQAIAEKCKPTIESYIKKITGEDDGLGMEELPPYYSLIFRSASVLEQGKFFFDGVFLSTNSYWGCSTEDKLSLILSSSWSPYALSCMNHANVKSHDMAIIVQKEINPRYSGQIIFTPEESLIKYNLGFTSERTAHVWQTHADGNPKNNTRKEGSRLLKEIKDAEKARDDNPLEYLHSHELSQKLQNSRSDLEVWKFENIYSHKLLNLRAHFAKPESKVQLEFVIGHDKELYLVQQRVKPLNEVSKQSRPLIPSDRIITDKLGCEMILDECGSAINMLTYKGSASIDELDAKYPGSVLILAGEKGWEHYKKMESSTKFDEFDESIKKALVDTPKRKAVILPLSKERWVHLYDAFNDLKVPVLAYDGRMDVMNSLKQIKTGDKLAIWSNGKESILYRRD